MTTSTRNLLIGASILGAMIILSKKRSGLGALDTAKTAKGRKKQRAAVFARMDADGETWPKKHGRRVKPRKKKRRK